MIRNFFLINENWNPYLLNYHHISVMIIIFNCHDFWTNTKMTTDDEWEWINKTNSILLSKKNFEVMNKDCLSSFFLSGKLRFHYVQKMTMMMMMDRDRTKQNKKCDEICFLWFRENNGMIFLRDHYICFLILIVSSLVFTICFVFFVAVVHYIWWYLIGIFFFLFFHLVLFFCFVFNFNNWIVHLIHNVHVL